MVIKKYSKSSNFYRKNKSSSFENNSEELKEALRINDFYKNQPCRNFCKICSTKLPSAEDFNSHGIDYVFCEACGHLNGRHEDTLEFVNFTYIDNGGKDYSAGYIDEAFQQRVKDIYIPKAEFLAESLPTNDLEILDVGCGAGYFVQACSLLNIKCSGIDVSKEMTDFGNAQISHSIKPNPLKLVDETSIYEEVASTNANVVSALGVIEHLREPKKFFDAFRKSKANYLFYLVPMFGLSAVLENVSSKAFPRLLSGGHTHLFTDTSLTKMNELMMSETIAEWRFGADTQDLLRHLLINVELNKMSSKTIKLIDDTLNKNIDAVQSVIDKSHFCSEAHILVQKIDS